MKQQVAMSLNKNAKNSSPVVFQMICNPYSKLKNLVVIGNLKHLFFVVVVGPFMESGGWGILSREVWPSSLNINLFPTIW